MTDKRPLLLPPWLVCAPCPAVRPADCPQRSMQSTRPRHTRPFPTISPPSSSPPTVRAPRPPPAPADLCFFSRPAVEHPLLVSPHKLCTPAPLADNPLLTPAELGKLSADALAAGRSLRRQALSAPPPRARQGLRLRPRPRRRRRLPPRPLRGVPQPQVVHRQHRRHLPHLQALSAVPRLAGSPALPDIKAQPKCCLLEYVLFCLRRA